MAFAFSVVIAFGAALAEVPTDRAGQLPTLTTAKQVHELRLKEAKRSYPVHLRGVVTNCHPGQDGAKAMNIWIHDATGAIFVLAPRGDGRVPATGEMVDVRGVSGAGQFAPMVDQGEVRVIGKADLPASAERVSLARLRTGVEDSQWVEIEGVVHAATEKGEQIVLEIAMADGTLVATTFREAGAKYSGLIDARVTIRGNAAPLFNANRQVIGGMLIFPGLSTVHILDAGPRDPFDQPAVAIDSLSGYDRIAAAEHRFHIRGRLTLQWPGVMLCVADATHGICAESAETLKLAIGDLVDVVGFDVNGRGAPTLSDAIFRRVPKAEVEGRGQPGVPVERLTAEEAIKTEHDANVVEVEGKLIGRDLGAPDASLMLESGKVIFVAVLPKELAGPQLTHWENGSRLRVTGICSVQIDAAGSARAGGAAVSKSFRVLLRSPADVVVLEKTSWWTPIHAVLLLGILMAVVLGAIAWVVALRRRVHRQTRVIRESEERFRDLAQQDGLTGTASRLLLHERMDAVLERSGITGTYLGVLMLDLDRFKQINDTLGHDAGDHTLRVTAERIRGVVRENDLVARIGGDEFIVLLSELDGPVDALRLAAKLVEGLSRPIRIGDNLVPVSASVGVCVSRGGELDSAGLLKSVDMAMYRAKAQGRNCYELFTPEMARASFEKARLLGELAHALERDEFELHYQPMVSFETGRLTGFEALLRWRSKSMGLMAPDTFIPLAEESGLIVPIGEWVVGEACREIGLLERESGQTFLLCVNLSPLQFQQEGLARMIERTLAEHGRSPLAVEFEMTENMLMSDSATTTGALGRLRDQGIRIAIDDFGVGFSSFSYIMRFGIDRIKIDRSFIKDLATDKGTMAVVRAIIAMAHGLGIEVVAEGVETAEQFSMLAVERCDTAQGYLLSRPVPASQLAALLKESFDIGARHPRVPAKSRDSGLHVA